ncbi:hypothetical protein [Paraburkholderia diazotrophica]|uniref:hypothetical protein n=1 Tax=Paraburkholderia diazotrophica TaxID=667676 RepID=UPI0031736EAE
MRQMPQATLRGVSGGERMQYDYVIVGAGSGGCSLAGRLAERCPDATNAPSSIRNCACAA